MRNILKISRGSGVVRSGWLLLGICVAWFAVSAQGQVLYSDNFNRTNDPAPITPWLEPGAVASAWTITGGTMQGGPNTANSYGYIYVTNTFTNASIQAQIRFATTNAWGGGVGGNLNTNTGAHYAAWLYPDNSGGGGLAIRLVKFSTWTAFGYEGTNFNFMAVTNVASVGTNTHLLRLAFTNPTIQVYYDGNPVITTTDGEATPYTNGAVSLDMFTDPALYTMNVDNLEVAANSTTPLAVADSYTSTSGTTLTVAAPGVLLNDTDGVGPLTAVSPTTAAHGTVNLNTNGGFIYTPTGGFSGTDSFTYKANDGHTSSAAATVSITVAADVPPVANNDSYTLIGNTTLTIAAPGILANDTINNNQSLTAILVNGPTNGLLTLTNNGGFGYVPTNNFSGTDTFTYKANDTISNSTPATVTLNVLPTSTLFYDGFVRSSDPGPIAPWVAQVGNWEVTGNALVTGGNTASSYSFAYLTNIWTNYTVQGQVAVATNTFGGGIGGRLTSGTGTHYAAWIYPEGSPGGGPALRLVKFSSYSSFGYLGTNFGFMAETNLTSVGTGFHTLKLGFFGKQIAVYLDGTKMINVADADAGTYPSGGVSADLFSSSSTDGLSLDNVNVSALVNNDSYSAQGGTTLIVSAPGVLANDTPVFTGSLTAAQVTGPSHGSLTLNANGSFNYTSTGGYSGPDSFTYQANDGTTNIGTATVNINVIFNGPGSTAFSENFDGVTSPALPSGWTTAATGIESNWVTTTVSNNTAPNAAFAPDVANIGNTELVTPVIAMPAGACQLTFKNKYNLEIDSTNSTDGFDGGVLEIKIGSGAFTDVITAGGSFLAGGYNTVINSTFNSAIAGRAAWSGNSGGYITTTVDLPPAASGQNVQLKWRCSTDNGSIASGVAGWWVDTVVISNCPSSVCWNTAPVLPTQTTQTINELTLLTVNNTATDTDGTNTLTYSLLSPPAGATIGSSSGIITWTPSQTQSPSTNTITTRVVDNGIPPLAATNSFTVIVKEVNVAPTLSAQTNRTNFGLASITITNSATESNIHATTTGYSLTSPPTGMTITTNGIINWTPTVSQVPGTYTVTTVATNKDTLDLVNPILTATNSFTIVEATIHNGPSLAGIGTQTVNELVQLTVTNTATDGDVPILPLTYFLTNSPPANASISTNGIIMWTPAQTQSPSTNTVTTVVTDGTKSATNNITVVVKEINVAPVPPVIGTQTVNELTQLTVTNTATEANIHSVVTNYTLSGGLAGMSIDNNGIFTWTPTQAQSATTNTVTVIVANTNAFDTVTPVLKATNTFTVIVKEINVAPVAAVVGTQTVNELTLLTVTNTATEANIHSVVTNYTIISPLAGMSITTNGIFTWTPPQTQSPGTDTVTIVVANTNKFDTVNPVLTATNSFTVVVNEVNQAPTLPTIGTQTVSEQVLLTVTNSATESNIHSTTTGYSLVSPLAGMNIDGSGVFTWTPTQAQSPSTNTVKTVVSNTNAFDTVNPVLFTTNTFTVVVRDVNIAPVLPVISPQTVNELNLLTVTNAAAEPNPHSTTTSYTLLSPLPGMNIDINGVFTWTPSQTQSPGTNTITTVVANSNQFDTINPVLKTTNTFSVVVKEVNQSPVLPTLATQTIGELQLLTVTNTAAEPNIHSTATSYTLVGPLAGMNIDTNGIFTWTPTQNQSPGTNLVTTIVANTNQFDTVTPVLLATNTFTVVVKEINVAPTLPAIGTQIVVEGNLLTVTNTASESNIHSTITGYSLVSPQPGMNIDVNGIFTWTPSLGQAGTSNVVTTVVANTNAFDTVNPVLLATNTFTVVVKDVNVAPQLPVITTQTVNELNLLTVTNTATEPDPRSVTTGYTLVSPLAGMSISSSGIFTWTPTQAQSPGTNTVTTVVANTNSSDSINPVLLATNTFTVVVKEVNQAPTLPAIATQTVNELNLLTVTNKATEPNIHSLTASYTLVSPLAGMNIDTNGVFTWTPSQAQSPGTNTVTTVVANTNAFDTVNPVLLATNSFTVVVKEINVAPVLPVIGTQTVNEQTLLTVNDAATEPNIHSTTTSYTLVTPLPGMNINSSGSFTWTPSQAQSPGTSTVTVVAANSNALDTVNPVLLATNSFTVVVKEINIAPVLSAIGTQTVNELTLLTLTNAATEPNIHSTTTGYSLAGPLAGMNIDNNGVFTWTPTQAQSHTTNTVNVVAANTNAFDTVNPVLLTTNSFTVVVKEINVAPVLPPIGTQTVNEQTLLTVTNTASEPNIHSITTGYTLISPLAGMNIDTNGIFTWTPAQTQSPGTNMVTVVAVNSNGFDNVNPVLPAISTFTVIVKEVNIAPVLPMIGTQTIAAGNVLTVANAATEPNIHAVTAGYLLVGAPVGMSITTNGIITWTPSTASTNTITTVVTNSDTFDLVNPALLATNSFTVVVTGTTNAPPAPVIQSLNIAGGNIILTWSAVSGANYQVQAKTNLTDTNWTAILPNMQATSATVSETNAVGSANQQFYRIQVLP